MRLSKSDFDYWRLHYTVVGIPEPTLNWFKDGHPLPQTDIYWSTSSEIGLKKEGRVNPQTGYYTLRVYNPLGTDTLNVSARVSPG